MVDSATKEAQRRLMNAIFAVNQAIGKCFYSVGLDILGERTNSDLILGSMNVLITKKVVHL